MRKLLKLGIITMSLVAVSGLAGAAQVAYGTFAFSNFGTGDVLFTDNPANNVLGATTTQIVLPGQIITSISPTYNFNPNSFCNATDCGGINGPDPNGRLGVGQALSFQSGTNTINISGGLASAIDFLFSSGTTPTFRYEFLANGPGEVTTTNFGGSTFLFISYRGQFTDAAGFFNNQEAIVSFTFTQSSPGATVGETASFSTPPVPEPASMALIGGGLVLIGLIARKRKKAYSTAIACQLSVISSAFRELQRNTCRLMASTLPAKRKYCTNGADS